MTVLSGRKVSDHMERISDAVEGSMIEAGYSVDALAAAAGWTPLRVHNRLDLEAQWSIDELDAVARVLGVEFVSLLGILGCCTPALEGAGIQTDVQP